MRKTLIGLLFNYKLNPPNTSLNLPRASLLSRYTLPQSGNERATGCVMWYFGFLSFQLTRLSSLIHLFADSDRIPIVSIAFYLFPSIQQASIFFFLTQYSSTTFPIYISNCLSLVPNFKWMLLWNGINNFFCLCFII